MSRDGVSGGHEASPADRAGPPVQARGDGGGRWLDVSQPLRQGVPTWPGDTPFTYEVAWPMAQSGSVNVGRVTMSIHTGTHIDAPYHFDDAGARTIDLHPGVFIGMARVVRVPRTRPEARLAAIRPEDFSGIDLRGVQRLLVRTDAWPDKSRFPDDIPAVDPGLAPFLESHGVRLLGIDLPSVDELDSKPLPGHHALSEHGICIVEGLVLDDIAAGDYEFVCVPLPLVDADGSPVRALVRPVPSRGEFQDEAHPES